MTVVCNISFSCGTTTFAILMTTLYKHLRHHYFHFGFPHPDISVFVPAPTVQSLQGRHTAVSTAVSVSDPQFALTHSLDDVVTEDTSPVSAAT